MIDAPRFDDDDLLFSPRFGDHYFSRHDGRAECAHVFVGGNDLPEKWQGRESFTIGELGFGTGLNFLETWATWQRCRFPGQRLNFLSVEGFPLDISTAKHALSNWPKLAEKTEQLLACWGGLGERVDMDEQTSLHVLLGDVRDMLPQFPMVDAWYLDGFAPARNPDMWSAEIMQMVADKTEMGGTFASYTAAGWVRRNLQGAGFSVEKRPGFGTKRDMIAGIKL